MTNASSLTPIAAMAAQIAELEARADKADIETEPLLNSAALGLRDVLPTLEVSTIDDAYILLTAGAFHLDDLGLNCVGGVNTGERYVPFVRAAVQGLVRLGAASPIPDSFKDFRVAQPVRKTNKTASTRAADGHVTPMVNGQVGHAWRNWP